MPCRFLPMSFVSAFAPSFIPWSPEHELFLAQLGSQTKPALREPSQVVAGDERQALGVQHDLMPKDRQLDASVLFGAEEEEARSGPTLSESADVEENNPEQPLDLSGFFSRAGKMSGFDEQRKLCGFPIWPRSRSCSWRSFCYWASN
eukprot:m.204357 g.204357  ORF g.204357 m.204357 type:complete len:147 (-) comp53865_c0_seq7:18-458(-)